MSLCINTITPEGIVLAADSRQSYRNQKGASRIGSDSASKVFKINDRIGVAVAGLAFLPENNVPKNISRFVEDFRITHDLTEASVKKTAEKLQKYFEGKYQFKKQLEKLQKEVESNLISQGNKKIKLDRKETHIELQFETPQGVVQKGVVGVEQLQFIVAGFNTDGNHQSAIVYIPGETEIKKDSSEKGKEYGASWIGQIDVVGRIVLGFDGRIGNLPFVKKAAEEIGEGGLKNQLSQLEYIIQWGTMTLQDGIDFSLLAIKTTAAMQRFSDGVKGDPGDMPGVGGPIDLAVITRDKGFFWVSKKKLRAEKEVVDIDEN